MKRHVLSIATVRARYAESLKTIAKHYGVVWRLKMKIDALNRKIAKLEKRLNQQTNQPR